MPDAPDSPQPEDRTPDSWGRPFGPQSDVLAIHPGAVGDVVLLGHLLARLGGRAAVVAKGQRGRLLRELTFTPPDEPGAEYPLAERVIDFDTWLMDGRVVLRSSGRRPEHFLGHCHRLIAFYPPTEAEVRRLARATQAHRHWLLPIRPDEDCPHHLLDLWAQKMDMKPLAAAHEGQAAGALPVWRVSAEHQAAALGAAARTGLEDGRPFVLIHPGSGGRIKCWPLENFVELARRLRDQGDMGVLFVVGEAEIDRWGEDALGPLAESFPLLRCGELIQLAGLLAQARAYAGNDSGPSHLAAALGTPTLALFGATNPVHFAPVGRAVRIVQGETMAAIAVETVLAELDALLRL